MNVDAICAGVNIKSLMIFYCRRRSGTAGVLFVSGPLVDGKMAIESYSTVSHIASMHLYCSGEQAIARQRDGVSTVCDV